MEATKKFVKYEYYTQKNFNFFEFANYRTKTGKIKKYQDINGLNAVLRFTQPTMLLDMENEGHVLIDEFLKTYPAVLAGEWKRTDLHAAEKAATKATLDSARAVIEAAKMTDKDVKDYATLKGYNLNSELDVLRAKIIGVAQTNPESFMETHFDPEKDLRVFILQAVKENKISYKNSTFYYGREAIGTNEEQVLVWLKDNKDILAILKHEIRGEKLPKKKIVKTQE